MPSGPKKRKAAKKRNAATIPPRGNGRESSGELALQSSPEARRMEDERTSETSGAAVSEDAVVDPDVNKEDKREGETSDSSDTSASSEGSPAARIKDLAPEQMEVPVGQAEDPSAEHSEPAKEVDESGDLGPMSQVAEVPLDEQTEPADIIEHPVERLASEPEELISFAGSTVPIEAVENLSLTEPAPGDYKEKDLSVSVAPTEEPPESFAPREQPLEYSEQAQHIESRETADEEQGAVAPQVPRRTSWLTCCGLLDAFFGGSTR